MRSLFTRPIKAAIFFFMTQTSGWIFVDLGEGIKLMRVFTPLR
jgi:hypothetical protein